MNRPAKAGFYLEFVMTKKQKATKAEVAKQPVKAPKNDHLQDEFAGQGGSYLIDPATHKRVKNTGDLQNG
jgi:hypothetical protein